MDLAAVEVEVDAVAGDDLAVALGDVADGDGGMPARRVIVHPVVTGAPPP